MICAAMGIVMLPCCLPLEFQPTDTSGRQQESMTIPKAAYTILEAPDDWQKNHLKHVEH